MVDFKKELKIMSEIELPTIEVELPSNGLGYNEEDNIPSKVNLRMLSVKDTKIMLSGGRDVSGIICKILSSCIVHVKSTFNRF
jgi:hypothetical protein